MVVQAYYAARICQFLPVTEISSISSWDLPFSPTYPLGQLLQLYFFLQLPSVTIALVEGTLGVPLCFVYQMFKTVQMEPLKYP